MTIRLEELDHKEKLIETERGGLLDTDLEEIDHKLTYAKKEKKELEKMRLEENQGTINYMELIRDALDYRKWFAFQMFYKCGEESRKPLTNAAFNRFSGGEKAMAMYAPLFAAVNAQYKKAGNENHPQIIALDEAFAGKVFMEETIRITFRELEQGLQKTRYAPIDMKSLFFSDSLHTNKEKKRATRRISCRNYYRIFSTGTNPKW